MIGRASLIQAGVVTGFLSFAQLAVAHHGGGTFDGRKEIELTGKLTRLDLINPHSWIYFDVLTRMGRSANIAARCASATVLRRSGWTKEMFKPGQRITIQGAPDRHRSELVLLQHDHSRGWEPDGSVRPVHERSPRLRRQA